MTRYRSSMPGPVLMAVIGIAIFLSKFALLALLVLAVALFVLTSLITAVSVTLAAKQRMYQTQVKAVHTILTILSGLELYPNIVEDPVRKLFRNARKERKR